MLIKASGAVLAGGKSSRMGKDKALLRLDNQTLLERTVGKLQNILSDVMIVSNESYKHSLPNVRHITDIYQGRGPLGGIHSAIKNAVYEHVFIVACDLPFWELEVVEILMEQCRGYDGAVPLFKGRPEPLLAVYTKRCLPVIEEYLIKKIGKVACIYQDLNINFVGEILIKSVNQGERIFCNINSPEDFREIQSIKTCLSKQKLLKEDCNNDQES